MALNKLLNNYCFLKVQIKKLKLLNLIVNTMFHSFEIIQTLTSVEK